MTAVLCCSNCTNCVSSLIFTQVTTLVQMQDIQIELILWHFTCYWFPVRCLSVYADPLLSISTFSVHFISECCLLCHVYLPSLLASNENSKPYSSQDPLHRIVCLSLVPHTFQNKIKSDSWDSLDRQNPFGSHTKFIYLFVLFFVSVLFFKILPVVDVQFTKLWS